MGSLRDFLDRRRMYGVVLKNLNIFNTVKEIGFEYLLNPDTGKLHRVTSDFVDSHNLHRSDLGEWICLSNIGLIDLHELPDGVDVPIYSIFTGRLIGTYRIDKCEHCTWD